MLKIVNISKSFGDTKAIKEVNFSVSPGKITGLLGLNGAGKTTIIRILLNIIQPTDGIIFYNEQLRDDSFYRKTGYVPEERGLYKQVKVVDVLQYLASLKGLDVKKCLGRCKQLLELFNSPDILSKKTDELSKGNQQIVQLMLALLHEPEILILDEPFTGFDPQNQEIAYTIIKEYAKKGNLVLLSTHLMDIAEILCDDILFLHQGELIYQGGLPQLMKDNAEKNPASGSLHDIFLEMVKRERV